MNQLDISLAVGRWIAALVLVGLICLLGYQQGRASRADEVAACGNDQATLTLDRDGLRSTVAALREYIKREKTAADTRAREAQVLLDARNQRIAALTTAAQQRQTKTLKKVASDEDCAALRDMPVCAAVADGLWPEADRAH